jgi:glycosyltransferase involved in cell wall biosynthesis
VSTKNKEESISLGLTTGDRCFVKPNAVNSRLFRKLDKVECRRKLGFPQDAFIISFVGAFIERKGANRVAAAIRQLTDKSVHSIFIGQGDVDPICDNILFKGALRHEQIPEYLCASDVFVLPTLKEGCCNAIVEAMSCGLPIISSNLSFNWDVLDDTNAVLIDPMNINAITDAIVKLRDNRQIVQTMSKMSLDKALSLTIDKRGEAILSFIKSCL